MSRVTLYSDGASKGNPGDAGIGVVITAQDGTVLREIAEYIGSATNNVAEYRALIRGLEEAAALGATEVDILTDSELMARQLSGVYRVKSSQLKPLYDEVIELLRCFARTRISHVMRGFNRRADSLANEGIARHRKSRGHRSPGPSETPEQGTLDL